MNIYSKTLKIVTRCLSAKRNELVDFWTPDESPSRALSSATWDLSCTRLKKEPKKNVNLERIGPREDEEKRETVRVLKLVWHP